MIFDSVGLPSSLLSKSINFPNFSPHFIIQFVRILKEYLKYTLILRGFDPCSPLYYLIRVYFIKMMSLVIFLTHVCVFLMTSRSCFVNTRWTHLVYGNLMKIKRRWLHDSLCTRENVPKYEHSDEGLKMMHKYVNLTPSITSELLIKNEEAHQMNMPNFHLFIPLFLNSVEYFQMFQSIKPYGHLNP